MELDVESFLLAATMQMVIAQRLVRTICKHCKKPYEMSIKQLTDFGQTLEDEELQLMLGKIKKEGTEVLTFYKGEGCEHCNNSGFKGRICIAEVLDVSDEIKKNISENTPIDTLLEIAKKEGLTNMFMDGIDKVMKGVTTLEEVLRVMHD